MCHDDTYLDGAGLPLSGKIATPSFYLRLKVIPAWYASLAVGALMVISKMLSKLKITISKYVMTKNI